MKVCKNITVQWKGTEEGQFWPAAEMNFDMVTSLTNSLQGMLMPHQFPTRYDQALQFSTRYAHAQPIQYKVCSCLTNSLQGKLMPNQFTKM